ncbi:MAG: DUF3137 domain-containing protein [Eubacterium sp.]|nr:DUF3137 domain-containing protein [Eubacterium sp.]
MLFKGDNLYNSMMNGPSNNLSFGSSLGFGGGMGSGFSNRQVLVHGRTVNNPAFQRNMEKSRREANEFMARMQGRSLSEKLDELERMRSKHNRVTGLILVVVLAIFTIPFVGAFTGNRMLASGMPILMMIGLPLILFLSTKNNSFSTKNFKALYKSMFVQDILSKKFENVYYTWDTGFPSESVMMFRLCRLGNRYSSEDYICATYRGVRFETSDVLIQQHTSSGKSSHTTTYFRGRMFVFDLPKTIEASIRIFPEMYAYHPSTDRRAEKLDMENVAFNKMFNVYASDPHYAFYLLTPDFMERIMYLKQKYGGILLNFMGNKLFVGIMSGRNAFDAVMNKEINYPDEMAKVAADADVIIDLMNALEVVPKM